MDSKNDIALAEVGDAAIPDVLEMEVLNTGARRAESQGSLPSTGATLDLRGPWYPKITPFRLLNILIPVSTATAKAITSFRGNSTVPETLEWISGVVVFLLLFHAGYYESDLKPPRFLAWAFETDCMDCLWRLLDFFSIPRPHYSSAERSDPLPINTPYHHLVPHVFVLFGMTKAFLTMNDISVASIWVEWLLAGLITSGLYIAGLYENNSAGIWPTFFEESRSMLADDDTTKSQAPEAVVAPLLACIIIVGVYMTILVLASGPSSYRYYRKDGMIYFSSASDPSDLQEPMKQRPHYTLNLFPLAAYLSLAFCGFSAQLIGLGYSLWLIFGTDALQKAMKRVVVRTIVHLSAFLASVLFLIFTSGAIIKVRLGFGPGLNTIENWRAGVLPSFLILGCVILPSCFCLWWSVKNVTRDIANTVVDRLFPVAFRRLHYAFQEIGDAFQDTSPV